MKAVFKIIRMPEWFFLPLILVLTVATPFIPAPKQKIAENGEKTVVVQPIGFRGQIPSNIERICIYAIMAIGLNIVMGFTGLLDLGYVSFMATGAVLTAVASVAVADPSTGAWLIPVGGRSVKEAEHLFHFPGAYPLIVLFCGIVCAILGILRGIPTMRLTGDYYAIVTLGLAEILYIYYRVAEWTGGPKSLSCNRPDMPTLFGRELYYDTPWFYYTVTVFLLMTIVAARHLRDSRTGRALAAIRLDPTAAMSCGVNVNHYKMIAFAISGFIGGVGGSLYMVWQTGFSAVSMEVWESILLVCCLVLGGLGSIRGAILGAIVLVALGEVLRQPLPKINFSTGEIFWDAWPQQARHLFYGITLVVLMRFRPAGVLPDRLAKEPLDDSEVARLRQSDTALYEVNAAGANDA
ncbi:MAG: branched-chain amino acid ABC transporter permease [Planctomycetota bacterium]|nr:branched-chain amino acid ABC transporter permease [Planctomycetota bacterium]